MEKHPSVDVSKQVMFTVNNMPDQSINLYKPLVWMSGASALAAVIAWIMTFANCQSVVYLLESLYFTPSLILL